MPLASVKDKARKLWAGIQPQKTILAQAKDTYNAHQVDNKRAEAHRLAKFQSAGGEMRLVTPRVGRSGDPHGIRAALTSTLMVLLMTFGALAEDTPSPVTDRLIKLLASVPLDREQRPDTRLFEPSKVLLLPHVFQGSTLSPAGQQDQLTIEVEFNETFFPYQGRPSAPDRHFGGWNTKFGITPMYRVRIWKENSAPVRVPSFMPKGTFQWEHITRRRNAQQWGRGADGSRKHIGVNTLMLTVGHHSNGQDGCLFALDSAGTAYPADACPEDPGDKIFINRLNGSFSTNYVEGSYYYSRLKLAYLKDDDKNKDNDKEDSRFEVKPQPYDHALWTHERRAKSALTAGVTYQFNFPFDSFGGALARPARPIYGMNRLRASVSYEKFWVESSPRPKQFWPRIWKRFKENSFKARTWAEITDKSKDAADCSPSGIADVPPCAPQLNWGLDFTFGIFSKADGLGLYSRFVSAQDNYNLSFTRRKANRFQVGLSFSLGRSRGPAFPVIEGNLLDEERQHKDDWGQYRKRIRKSVKEAIAASECEVPTCKVLPVGVSTPPATEPAAAESPL